MIAQPNVKIKIYRKKKKFITVHSSSSSSSSFIFKTSIFSTQLGLDVCPDMKPLHISLNTAHSACKPSSFISSFTHSYQVYTCIHQVYTHSSLYPHISPLPPPHFYRPTPNHLRSYVPHAQTTSIYHTPPLLPRSEYPKDCTSLHFASYPSGTHHTSISPSCALLSPGYVDSQPSLPTHVSVPYVNTLWTQALKIFPFMQCDAPRAIRMGDSSLNLAQAHRTLALAASSTPPPAPCVSPK